jgi:hypothetical protein
VHPAWRRYTTLTTLGLGLIVLAVATTLLGVRELVSIGTCASSPVFVSLRPCPDTVAPLIVLVGVMPFLGAIGWAFYVLRTDRRSPSAWSEGPDWSSWWWPALFFGLGWQFIALGRTFLADDQLGAAIGMWSVTAVFALMAAVPLLLTLPALRRNLFGGPRPPGGGDVVERLNAGLARATGAGGAGPAGPVAATGGGAATGTGGAGTATVRPVEVAVRVADALTGGVGRTMAGVVVAAAERNAAAQGDAAAADLAPADDLAGSLERLAALHAAGHVTEAEFAAAKAQVLRRARGEGR